MIQKTCYLYYMIDLSNFSINSQPKICLSCFGYYVSEWTKNLLLAFSQIAMKSMLDDLQNWRKPHFSLTETLRPTISETTKKVKVKNYEIVDLTKYFSSE